MGSNSITGTGQGSAEGPLRGRTLDSIIKVLDSDKHIIFSIVGEDIVFGGSTLSISGYSGFSGTSGYSGRSGTSGYSGFSGSGISGTSGFSGISGAMGVAGDDGQSGFSGVSGISGVSGASGTSGGSGISGFSGAGVSGISGFSGASGVSGDMGLGGDSGYSGTSGTSGRSGFSGTSGFSGNNGSDGASGIVGASGVSGFSGMSGLSGAAPATVVIGPVSSTDNAIVRFDGTTGVLVQNSSATLSDSGELTLAKEHINSGSFSTAEDAESFNAVLRNSTSDGSQTELFINGSSTRLTLPNDTTWGFEVRVAARRTDSDGESAYFIFTGCIDRNTDASSTSLVGTVNSNIVARDSSAWAVAVDNDNTNGSLRVRVTGEAAKTIYWVGYVRIINVTG